MSPDRTAIALRSPTPVSLARLLDDACELIADLGAVDQFEALCVSPQAYDAIVDVRAALSESPSDIRVLGLRLKQDDRLAPDAVGLE